MELIAEELEKANEAMKAIDVVISFEPRIYISPRIEMIRSTHYFQIGKDLKSCQNG